MFTEFIYISGDTAELIYSFINIVSITHIQVF